MKESIKTKQTNTDFCQGNRRDAAHHKYPYINEKELKFDIISD